MRVCFLGAYDPGYARNRILRAGLVAAGVELTEVRAPAWRAFRRFPALAAGHARAGGAGDVVFVPEFRHKDVPLARLLAGGRPVVFDPFVSRADTLVGDWRLHAPGSAQARWNRWIDRWSLRSADFVVCDTWAHARLFESLGARPGRLRRIPVGAEAAFFAIPPRVPAETVEILYAGGFLPLHGVPVVLEAVARLEADSAKLPPFRVRLIGDGIQHAAACELAGRLGLGRVEFAGRRPYAELPAAIAGADIVLGAFGATEKAGRVIPHKVWQGLAAGRVVVTGDAPAVRELFRPDLHVELVPRGDAEALAASLAGLLRDRGRRERLSRHGAARARETGTEEVLGAALRDVLAESLAAVAPRGVA
jgi:glycosyltransferase involved in cell wall biosynthesis